MSSRSVAGTGDVARPESATAVPSKDPCGNRGNHDSDRSGTPVRFVSRRSRSIGRGTGGDRSEQRLAQQPASDVLHFEPVTMRIENNLQPDGFASRSSGRTPAAVRQGRRHSAADIDVERGEHGGTGSPATPTSVMVGSAPLGGRSGRGRLATDSVSVAGGTIASDGVPERSLSARSDDASPLGHASTPAVGVRADQAPTRGPAAAIMDGAAAVRAVARPAARSERAGRETSRRRVSIG